MQIKCENCSIVYEVSENHLIIRHPKFLKCTSCGHVFQTPKLQEAQEEQSNPLPPVEQSDSIPMSLSEIFQMPEENENLEPKQTEIQTTDSSKETQVFEDIISEPIRSVAPTADLFAPFDRADEFMPVTETDAAKKKRLLGVLLLITFLTFALIYFLYAGRYYFVRRVGVPPVLYQTSGIETNVVGEGLAFQNTLFNVLSNQENYQLSVKSKIINTTDADKNLPEVVIYLKDENGQIVQQTKPALGKSILAAGEILPFEANLHPIAQTARSIEITFEKDAR